MTSTSHSRFIVAAGQLTSIQDLDANLATCRDLAAQAAGQKASLLVLPECFAYVGRQLTDKFTVAESLDETKPGPILKMLRDIATKHQLWVIAGGLPERLADESSLPSNELTSSYNTAVVLNPTGQIIHKYRKIHLFDVAIPGRAEFRESDCTTAGDQVVVADIDLANIGLSICYDLRFPELYRDMALNRGAELIVVPAAFTAHTGAAHWHTLLRARAIENQCYVIAAAQTGDHHSKRASYGHSLIIDPWGTVIAELESGVGLVVAEVDLDVIAKTRLEMPCLEHQVLGVGG